MALPSAPLDYAGQARGPPAVLRGGPGPAARSGHTADWPLWRVDGSPGLVSGPATLTSIVPDHLTLSVSQPGPITLRVRYTAFWTVTKGLACLSPAPGGWIAVNALTAGATELSATMLPPVAAGLLPQPQVAGRRRAARAGRPAGPRAAAQASVACSGAQAGRNSAAPRSRAWQPWRSDHGQRTARHRAPTAASSTEAAIAITRPSRL